jgi:hypothetical protein
MQKRLRRIARFRQNRELARAHARLAEAALDAGLVRRWLILSAKRNTGQESEQGSQKKAAMKTWAQHKSLKELQSGCRA